jgi:tetratricopeptide (TPR) repeat protein
MGLFDAFRDKRKEPAPDYLPPGMYQPDPHKKEAEGFAQKALSLMQTGLMSGSDDLVREALVNADLALELDPENYNALQCRVVILTMTGKDDREKLLEALACSDRALAIEKDSPVMWFNKAGILEQLGWHEEALAAYDRVLSLPPASLVGHGGTLVAKGRTLGKLGRDNDAFKLYESVPENDRAYGDALTAKAAWMERNGNRQAALAFYRQAAGVYAKRGADRDAAGCYDSILGLDPADIDALFLKGAALLNQYSPSKPASMLADAEACFAAVHEKDPSHAGALTGLGRCRYEAGRFEDSIMFYDHALARAPADYEALVHKAFALKRLLRFDEAVAACDLAHRAAPGASMPWSLRAMILYEQGKDEEALRDIDRAIAIAERDHTHWQLRALVLRRLGRNAAADEAEQTAQRYDPRRFLRM